MSAEVLGAVEVGGANIAAKRHLEALQQRGSSARGCSPVKY